MKFPIVKGAGYVLVNTPDMVVHNGSTQTTERLTNPDSDYLKGLNEHIRSFDEVVAYLPNQVYIGNLHPEKLKEYDMPWFDKESPIKERFGKYGEIMPQDEFIGLMKMADAFDLVKLEKKFAAEVKQKLQKHPRFDETDIEKIKEGLGIEEITKQIDEYHAEGIYMNGQVVGCVKRAHDIDINLNAHTMFENIVVKASGALALKNLIAKNDLDPASIEYVIECSEEACGDINQRGGGNFAKAIAEMAGAVNATGSDTRGFCAAPTHALINASALVQAGVYENVVIVAGGATAKLGMNGKDHVKKGYPVLEDVLGGFAIMISRNDGVGPVIRTDLVGRHTVGTGSSPQAVITSLITAPLDKGNLKITDIDKYSVEMQNPDITKPAGAGDVPTSNYKMIGALGVKRKEIDRKDLMSFVEEHGLPGWAPTQGHIPSGVPYVGFAIDDMADGKIGKAMIVGKGSLFLGRMTNLFDGVSVILEKNTGMEEKESVSKEEIKKLIAEAMRGFAETLTDE
ncbi:MAG TPA: glycine/sarcosine/betaine reductase complex component C subunit beta [Clostridia bacterium]|nr:glycine/sarcosine/betaine reductase complex component C subunit beta [Clostridia bacterium]